MFFFHFRSRRLASILAKVCKYIGTIMNCLLNVYRNHRYSFKVRWQIICTIFIKIPCANYRKISIWKYLTITNSPICWIKLWILDSKQLMHWPKCAQFESVLSKAGAPNTTGRTSHRHRAGSKFTWMDRSHGWIRFSCKWAHHYMPLALFLKSTRALFWIIYNNIKEFLWFRVNLLDNWNYSENMHKFRSIFLVKFQE